MADSLFITDRRKNAGCATQFPYVCRLWRRKISGLQQVSRAAVGFAMLLAQSSPEWGSRDIS
jgi:hypothetical protein